MGSKSGEGIWKGRREVVCEGLKRMIEECEEENREEKRVSLKNKEDRER